MNTRKFYFILTLVLSLCLFISGLSILNSLSTVSAGTTNSAIGKILEPFQSTKDPVNVLVLVGDASSGNTDTMMVVNYNPNTAQINLLSIPRDTKVRVKRHTAKINSAYAAGGAETAVETVSDLLGININYYFYVSIETFRGIIDKLGGVDFYVPVNLKYSDPTQNLYIDLKKGQQHLDGKKAEQLLRFRKPNGKISKEMSEFYDGSDLKREDMQHKFLKELIKQKANVFYISKMNEILTYIFKNVKTNMDLDDALGMSQNISKLRSNELRTFKISGYSPNTGSIWYFIFDGKIYDSSTDETYPADEILNQYFSTKEGFVPRENNYYEEDGNNDSAEKNTNSKSTTKKSTTKNNPSNSDSSLKGTNKNKV